MDFNELEELIRLFEASNLNELEVEEEGRRVRLQKAPPWLTAPAAGGPSAVAAAVGSAAAMPGSTNGEEDATQGKLEDGLLTIDSPMVGTFYVAPSPGEAPFVRVGDRVEESATVCIVEAMKLMNEVEAKFACTIERVLVENGEPVEFGQPLFVVRALE